MEPRIETIGEKKLVGRRIEMSMAANRTGALWRGFMPERGTVGNRTGTELYSVEIFPARFFEPFNPDTPFEKWAAVEVEDFWDIPEGMKRLTIPAGLYAVFLHRGPASEGPATYRYIFTTWLPASPFLPDDRPHFAVMAAKYMHDDPASEEEIWIPVRRREQ